MKSMIESFTDLFNFLNTLSVMNTCNCKKECERIKIIIQSMVNTKYKKYEIDINNLENYFDISLYFLYDRKKLAKIMEWDFLYDNTELIIKMCKKLFSKLYNYTCDFKKHNSKYD